MPMYGRDSWEDEEVEDGHEENMADITAMLQVASLSKPARGYPDSTAATGASCSSTDIVAPSAAPAHTAADTPSPTRAKQKRSKRGKGGQ